MFFDGKVGTANRSVSLAGKKAKADSAKELLENTRKQREQREVFKRKNEAATCIQTWTRRFLTIKQLTTLYQEEFDKKVDDINKIKNMLKLQGVIFNVPLNTLSQLLSYLFILCNRRKKTDTGRVLVLQQFLIDSLSTTSKDYNYLLSLNYKSSDVSGDTISSSLYKYIRFLQFSVSSVTSNVLSLSSGKSGSSFNRTMYDHGISFLNKTFFSEVTIPKDLLFLLSSSIVNELSKGLKELWKDISSSSLSTSNELQTVTHLFLTIIVLVFKDVTAEMKNGLLIKYQEKSMKAILLNIFTIPNVFNHSIFQRLVGSIPILDLNLKEIISKLFPSISSSSSTNFSTSLRLQQQQQRENSQLFTDKLLFLSNFSLLFLEKKSNNSSKMVNFHSEWLQLIEEILFHFSTSSPVSSSSSNSSGFSYFPLASALRYLEYKSFLTTDNSSTKMVIDNEEEEDEVAADKNHHAVSSASASSSSSSVSEEKVHLTMTENIANEIVSDYLVANSNKKLEYHNIFLLHSLQLLESSSLSHLRELSEAIQPIIHVLTDPDFLTILINQIFFSSPSSSTSSAGSLRSLFSFLRIYSFLLNCFNIELPNPLYESTTISSLSTRYSQLKFNLLNIFAFSKNSLVIKLWEMMKTNGSFSIILNLFLSLDEIQFNHHPEVKRFLQLFEEQSTTSSTSSSNSVAVLRQSLFSFLYFFSQVFIHQLSAVDDEELLTTKTVEEEGEEISSRNKKVIFPISDLSSLVLLLKQCMMKFYWNDVIYETNINSTFLFPSLSLLHYSQLLRYCSLTTLTSLFNHLCIRNERRSFLIKDEWSWNNILQPGDFTLVDQNSDIYSRTNNNSSSSHNPSSNSSSTSSSLSMIDIHSEDGEFFIRNGNVKLILLFIPQVIPFKQRVSLFQSLVEHDKINYYSSLGGAANNVFAMMGGHQHNVHASIRRDHIIEDSIKDLNSVVGYKLKGKIQIEFVSEQGLQEAGIDGGGLFKEFMDSFAKAIFDPGFGLFTVTSEHLLTINPGSNIALGDSYLTLFYFVGKMLGKALYEVRSLLFLFDLWF
jgi:hypothetical protein